MRYNKSAIESLALNPQTTFEKEGLLIITERQEGLFRTTDVLCQRWCKLHGNLLIYLKDESPRSNPIGLLVLENCRIKISEYDNDSYAFSLEFDIGPPQRIAAPSESERRSWIRHIQNASICNLEQQIKYLKNQIALKKNQNYNDKNNLSLCAPAYAATTMQKVANTSHVGKERATAELSANVEADLLEVPLSESTLCCDNLRCDSSGRKPNARVICSVLLTDDDSGEDYLWRDYVSTEIVENSINPQFLCTFRFYASGGFTTQTSLRFTVYDIRELVSMTAISLGYAEIELGVLQETTHFRIPLRSIVGDSGFITISTYMPEHDSILPAMPQQPPRSITQVFEQQNQQQSKGHRRSQSLPLKLCTNLFVPYHGNYLQKFFANPILHTYRLNSSIAGDISVEECMMESKLYLIIPQQLLTIWIAREKELLQEISGMGELGGEWRGRQIDLLDKHLKLLNDYSDAKQYLQQLSVEKKGVFFKRSADKGDESLEFLPVNLHLQRMWTESPVINQCNVLDVVTVGAFTKHVSKARTGGLIRLLQEATDSPSKYENSCVGKVQAANEVVQTIKQLRKEIVEIMSQILLLAKCKNSADMMPMCNEMVLKTKTLLNIWDPHLVEEAFNFIEQHRIIDEPENAATSTPLSPFRKITQQLDALDLKSPELEDFATPIATTVPPDLWPSAMPPHTRSQKNPLLRSNSLRYCRFTTTNTQNVSPKEVGIGDDDDSDVNDDDDDEDVANSSFNSLPITLTTLQNAANTHVAISNTSQVKMTNMQQPQQQQQQQGNNAYVLDGVAILQQARSFLNTHNMSVSPSANYYRPTEEPEPLDLTQLNIEASVMCLVSKIKFLCGRCGSPAIRLRLPKEQRKHTGFSHNVSPTTTSITPDVVAHRSEVVVTCSHGHNEAPEKTQSNVKPESAMAASSTGDGKKPLAIRKGNKFTDGLDLSLTTDWLSELRPSMRKLRQAMDGLLKTARLIHSVQRLQQDIKRNSINLEKMYRRDVCFSQALTTLVTALMARLWGNDITANFLQLLNDLGPLAYFEGLLSLYGGEIDMWGDMCIAIEDLSGVNFVLERSTMYNDGDIAPPRVTGSRHAMCVALPVPEPVYALIPKNKPLSFRVTPVFFNIGINEKAVLSRTRDQHRSNWDNYKRLEQYYSRYRKINFQMSTTTMQRNVALCGAEMRAAHEKTLPHLLDAIEGQLRENLTKNVNILHMVENVCRLMSGLRFTSCKSAKDRTGMAVTLEQCRVLVQEFKLPAKSVPIVLSAMRREGTRMDNVQKNIGKRKYAFNLPQVFALPTMYRPPTGSYGKAET